MSVANEILRLQQAKSDLATSIENKGVTVPAATTLDGYAALVDQIQQGGTLPYDAEIDYLECTGTQYIDTGITLVSGTTEVKLVFEAAITAFVSGSNSLMISHSTPNSGVQVYTTSNRVVNQGALVSASANTFYTFTTTTTASQRTIQSNYGSPVTQSFSRSITDNSILHIMGFPSFVASERNSKAKYKFFRVYVNSKIVRFFIPVRLGQVGYMYDKISGQLFGNAGTGNFILGADIT
jgi:hypothetical protein